MPGKSKALRGTGQPQNEEADFIPREKMPIAPAERLELRTFFESTSWQKVLFNARQCRPPEFPIIPATATDDMRRQLMSEQLCRRQGWLMFEHALAAETLVPKERQPKVPDNYPDAGRIDALVPQQPEASPGALPPPASTIHPAKKR